MLELREARSIILGRAKKTAVISKNLYETLNYVLAEDIKSDINYPPFTRSKMDGLAVHADELNQASSSNPVILDILETVQAGRMPSFKIKRGDTAKVMTGAPLPEGADAVVPFEEVSLVGSRAFFTGKIRPGQYLSFEGEELKKGQVVLKRGKVIGPGEMAALALSGKSEVKVYRRPQAGILVTGEEISCPGIELDPAKIRDTNSYMLAGLVKRAGGVPVLLGTAGDKKDEIVNIINNCLPKLDIIITTGGTASGEYDLTEGAFQSAGAEIFFRGVAMKPGNYAITAGKEGRYLFGLSGRPSAAFVSFEKLVRPLLWHMMGAESEWEIETMACLNGSIEGNFPEDRYYKAYSYIYEGNSFAAQLRGSGMLSITEVNSLVYIPKGKGPFRQGDKVQVQLLTSLEAVGKIGGGST